MMKKNYYPASNRGEADYGWLKAKYSFSFAQYYNPDLTGVGPLRVLNDDSIAPGKGFDMHPHHNMEIITIPLEGELQHKDDLGHEDYIKAGEIQIMSAGSGIMHSEYNPSQTELLKLLQIWIEPDELNSAPQYAKYKIQDWSKTNDWVQLVSPFTHDDGGRINQKAWLFYGDFTKSHLQCYTTALEHRALYVFVIEGEAMVEGIHMYSRDALSLTGDVLGMEVRAMKNTRLLLFDLPMLD